MVLEGLEELDDRWMVEVCQDASLDEDFLDAPLIDKPMKKHLLQCIVGWYTLASRIKFLLHRSIFELNLKDGAVCAVTNLIARGEISPLQDFGLAKSATFSSFNWRWLLWGHLLTILAQWLSLALRV